MVHGNHALFHMVLRRKKFVFMRSAFGVLINKNIINFSSLIATKLNLLCSVFTIKKKEYDSGCNNIGEREKKKNIEPHIVEYTSSVLRNNYNEPLQIGANTTKSNRKIQTPSNGWKNVWTCVNEYISIILYDSQLFFPQQHEKNKHYASTEYFIRSETVMRQLTYTKKIRQQYKIREMKGRSRLQVWS